MTGEVQNISLAPAGARAYRPDPGRVSVATNHWHGRFILNSAGEALWTKDNRGKIIFPKACDLRVSEEGIVEYKGVYGGRFVWWRCLGANGIEIGFSPLVD